MAQEADKTLPAYSREDHNGTCYWTKDEWQREYQNGRGVLSVRKPPKPGASHHLVDENGVVASESEQQKMRSQLHAAWRTLLNNGLAHITWMSADIRALEFVRLTMRQAFVHFRLCDGHWKIYTFSSRHYPQRTSRPKDDNRAGVVKREKFDEDVKLEPAVRDSMSTASSSKRPQSVAISPQSRTSKRKKDAHRISSLSLSTTVASSTAVQNHTVAPRPLPIIIPLTSTMPDEHESDHISEDITQSLDDPIALTTDIVGVPPQSTSAKCQPQLQVQVSSISELLSVAPSLLKIYIRSSIHSGHPFKKTLLFLIPSIVLFPNHLRQRCQCHSFNTYRKQWMSMLCSLCLLLLT